MESVVSMLPTKRTLLMRGMENMMSLAVKGLVSHERRGD